MADQQKSDMFMQFVIKGKDKVSAECVLDKDKGDTYMTDFNPAGYQDYSDFFEIQKFSFDFQVKDQDRTKQKAGTSDAQRTQTTGQRSKQALATGEFASWRSATLDEAKKMKFPLEFDSFKFERIIDAASPVFFQHCVDSVSFEKAIFVKRVSVGGNNMPRGYLKIEFGDVLITRVDWDDGDMTTEKCEFICRTFDLVYKQQDPSGDLSSRGESSASWDYKKDALNTPD